jgi:tetratricopeptide (TPR) repeat protein
MPPPPGADHSVILDRHDPAVPTLGRSLDRACQLLDTDTHERAALLPELARALRENGALDTAESVLAEALDKARRYDDDLSEHRAEIERVRLTFMREPLTPEAVRAIAQRAITVFERAGNDADLADAWQLMGIAELSAGDRHAQLQALLRARHHAIASGDTGARSTPGMRSAARCSSDRHQSTRCSPP